MENSDEYEYWGWYPPDCDICWVCYREPPPFDDMELSTSTGVDDYYRHTFYWGLRQGVHSWICEVCMECIRGMCDFFWPLAIQEYQHRRPSKFKKGCRKRAADADDWDWDFDESQPPYYSLVERDVEKKKENTSRRKVLQPNKGFDHLQPHFSVQEDEAQKDVFSSNTASGTSVEYKQDIQDSACMSKKEEQSITSGKEAKAHKDASGCNTAAGAFVEDKEDAACVPKKAKQYITSGKEAEAEKDASGCNTTASGFVEDKQDILYTSSVLTKEENYVSMNGYTLNTEHPDFDMILYLSDVHPADVTPSDWERASYGPEYRFQYQQEELGINPRDRNKEPMTTTSKDSINALDDFDTLDDEYECNQVTSDCKKTIYWPNLKLQEMTDKNQLTMATNDKTKEPLTLKSIDSNNTLEGRDTLNKENQDLKTERNVVGDINLLVLDSNDSNQTVSESQKAGYESKPKFQPIQEKNRFRVTPYDRNEDKITAKRRCTESTMGGCDILHEKRQGLKTRNNVSETGQRDLGSSNQATTSDCKNTVFWPDFSLQEMDENKEIDTRYRPRRNMKGAPLISTGNCSDTHSKNVPEVPPLRSTNKCSDICKGSKRLRDFNCEFDKQPRSSNESVSYTNPNYLGGFQDATQNIEELPVSCWFDFKSSAPVHKKAIQKSSMSYINDNTKLNDTEIENSQASTELIAHNTTEQRSSDQICIQTSFDEDIYSQVRNIMTGVSMLNDAPPVKNTSVLSKNDPEKLGKAEISYSSNNSEGFQDDSNIIADIVSYWFKYNYSPPVDNNAKSARSTLKNEVSINKPSLLCATDDEKLTQAAIEFSMFSEDAVELIQYNDTEEIPASCWFEFKNSPPVNDNAVSAVSTLKNERPIDEPPLLCVSDNEKLIDPEIEYAMFSEDTVESIQHNEQGRSDTENSRHQYISKNTEELPACSWFQFENSPPVDDNAVSAVSTLKNERPIDEPPLLCVSDNEKLADPEIEYAMFSEDTVEPIQHNEQGRSDTENSRHQYISKNTEELPASCSFQFENSPPVDYNAVSAVSTLKNERPIDESPLLCVSDNEKLPDAEIEDAMFPEDTVEPIQHNEKGKSDTEKSEYQYISKNTEEFHVSGSFQFKNSPPVDENAISAVSTLKEEGSINKPSLLCVSDNEKLPDAEIEDVMFPEDTVEPIQHNGKGKHDTDKCGYQYHLKKTEGLPVSCWFKFADSLPVDQHPLSHTASRSKEEYRLNFEDDEFNEHNGEGRKRNKRLGYQSFMKRSEGTPVSCWFKFANSLPADANPLSTATTLKEEGSIKKPSLLCASVDEKLTEAEIECEMISEDTVEPIQHNEKGESDTEKSEYQYILKNTEEVPASCCFQFENSPPVNDNTISAASTLKEEASTKKTSLLCVSDNAKLTDAEIECRMFSEDTVEPIHHNEKRYSVTEKSGHQYISKNTDELPASCRFQFENSPHVDENAISAVSTLKDEGPIDEPPLLCVSDNEKLTDAKIEYAMFSEDTVEPIQHNERGRSDTENSRHQYISKNIEELPACSWFQFENSPPVDDNAVSAVSTLKNERPIDEPPLLCVSDNEKLADPEIEYPMLSEDTVEPIQHNEKGNSDTEDSGHQYISKNTEDLPASCRLQFENSPHVDENAISAVTTLKGEESTYKPSLLCVSDNEKLPDAEIEDAMFPEDTVEPIQHNEKGKNDTDKCGYQYHLKKTEGLPVSCWFKFADSLPVDQHPLTHTASRSKEEYRLNFEDDEFNEHNGEGRKRNKRLGYQSFMKRSEGTPVSCWFKFANSLPADANPLSTATTLKEEGSIKKPSLLCASVDEKLTEAEIECEMISEDTVELIQHNEKGESDTEKSEYQYILKNTEEVPASCCFQFENSPPVNDNTISAASTLKEEASTKKTSLLCVSDNAKITDAEIDCGMFSEDTVEPIHHNEKRYSVTKKSGHQYISKNIDELPASCRFQFENSPHVDENAISAVSTLKDEGPIDEPPLLCVSDNEKLTDAKIEYAMFSEDTVEPIQHNEQGRSDTENSRHQYISKNIEELPACSWFQFENSPPVDDNAVSAVSTLKNERPIDEPPLLCVSDNEKLTDAKIEYAMFSEDTVEPIQHNEKGKSDTEKSEYQYISKNTEEFPVSGSFQFKNSPPVDENAISAVSTLKEEGSINKPSLLCVSDNEKLPDAEIEDVMFPEDTVEPIQHNEKGKHDTDKCGYQYHLKKTEGLPVSCWFKFADSLPVDQHPLSHTASRSKEEYRLNFEDDEFNEHNGEGRKRNKRLGYQSFMKRSEGTPVSCWFKFANSLPADANPLSTATTLKEEGSIKKPSLLCASVDEKLTEAEIECEMISEDTVELIQHNEKGESDTEKSKYQYILKNTEEVPASCCFQFENSPPVNDNTISAASTLKEEASTKKTSLLCVSDNAKLTDAEIDCGMFSEDTVEPIHHNEKRYSVTEKSGHQYISKNIDELPASCRFQFENSPHVDENAISAVSTLKDEGPIDEPPLLCVSDNEKLTDAKIEYAMFSEDTVEPIQHNEQGRSDTENSRHQYISKNIEELPACSWFQFENSPPVDDNAVSAVSTLKNERPIDEPPLLCVSDNEKLTDAKIEYAMFSEDTVEPIQHNEQGRSDTENSRHQYISKNIEELPACSWFQFENSPPVDDNAVSAVSTLKNERPIDEPPLSCVSDNEKLTDAKIEYAMFSEDTVEPIQHNEQGRSDTENSRHQYISKNIEELPACSWFQFENSPPVDDNAVSAVSTLKNERPIDEPPLSCVSDNEKLTDAKIEYAMFSEDTVEPIQHNEQGRSDTENSRHQYISKNIEELPACSWFQFENSPPVDDNAVSAVSTLKNERPIDEPPLLCVSDNEKLADPEIEYAMFSEDTVEPIQHNEQGRSDTENSRHQYISKNTEELPASCWFQFENSPPVDDNAVSAVSTLKDEGPMDEPPLLCVSDNKKLTDAEIEYAMFSEDTVEPIQHNVKRKRDTEKSGDQYISNTEELPVSCWFEFKNSPTVGNNSISAASVLNEKVSPKNSSVSHINDNTKLKITEEQNAKISEDDAVQKSSDRICSKRPCHEYTTCSQQSHTMSDVIKLKDAVGPKNKLMPSISNTKKLKESKSDNTNLARDSDGSGTKPKQTPWLRLKPAKEKPKPVKPPEPREYSVTLVEKDGDVEIVCTLPNDATDRNVSVKKLPTSYMDFDEDVEVIQPKKSPKSNDDEPVQTPRVRIRSKAERFKTEFYSRYLRPWDTELRLPVHIQEKIDEVDILRSQMKKIYSMFELSESYEDDGPAGGSEIMQIPLSTFNIHPKTNAPPQIINQRKRCDTAPQSSDHISTKRSKANAKTSQQSDTSSINVLEEKISDNNTSVSCANNNEHLEPKTVDNTTCISPDDGKITPVEISTEEPQPGCSVSDP